MSRKSDSALLVSTILVVVVASWSYWLSVPRRLPGLAVGRQLTHDGLVKTNLASDGANLYFTEISGSHSVISRVPVAGGEVSQYPLSFPNAQLLDVSRTHAELLAAENTPGPSAEHPIWVSSLKGGAKKRFGTATGQEAVWSPDGRRVLTTKGSTLFVTPSGGGHAKELVTVPGTPYYPRYSPDGLRIRFSVGDIALNSSTIWEVQADGSNLHQILQNWRGASTKCCGNWTADGRYYLFQATGTELGDTANVWAVGETTTRLQKKTVDGPIQLTEGAVSFGRPAPSSEPNKFWALGLILRGTVVKYDLESGKPVPYLSGISATDLDFSPDGKWIAYVSVPDGALWRCRVDGSEAMQLTPSPFRAALPKWSRDGKLIAYINVETGKPWTIFVVPANGGPSLSLLSDDQSEVDINWSLDGEKIIFGRITLRKPEGLGIQVYDLKTRKLSTIPGSDGLFSPRLSPDGRYIAALSYDLTTLKLYDTEAKTWSDWQTVASGALNYPAWSEDSKSIYFDDLVSGEGAYCRAKVGENHYDQVLDLSGLDRYPGVLGLWSGRAPDGSPLFVKDSSTEEVFELQASLP